MKSLYKKISSVSLIGILAVPFLSQGFVVHANYRSLNNSGHEEISLEEFENFIVLVEYEQKYNYYFRHLNGEPKKEDVDYISHKYRGYSLFKAKYEYEDVYKFRDALKKGVFDIYLNYDYRNSLDPIYIRIGSIWYKFFFNLSPHQKYVVPIKESFKANGFIPIYASRNDSIDGRADLRAYLLNDRFRELKDLQGRPKYEVDHLVLELIKGPKKQHIFDNFKLFEMDIENSEDRAGYYIYRIGYYDFLVKKLSN